MITANDIVNGPVQATLGGVPVLVRQLGVLEVLAAAERYVIESHIKRMQTAAKALTGSDKVALIERMSASIPDGNELEDAARAVMAGGKAGSVPKALVLDILRESTTRTNGATLSVDEITELYTKATKEEVQPVLRHILGTRKKVPALIPDASSPLPSPSV